MKILDLSSQKKIINAQYWSNKVDQMYHPTGEFGQECADIVYASDIFDRKKFLAIILKELFYLVKKDAYLILDYNRDILTSTELEEQLWWLWPTSYDVVFHDGIEKKDEIKITEKSLLTFIREKTNSLKSSQSNRARLICKKIISTKIEKDAIDKWTFGIITNGERNDWIEKMIQSIKIQKIPNYEIIICGEYFIRDEKNIVYVPFNFRNDRGWISKKKNIIARNAKYNNLCIMHDRLLLDKNWYEGMKKFGNVFDAMSCRQILENGVRSGDWLSTNGAYNKDTFRYQLYKISSLDYRDWDRWGYLGGQLTIIKKHVWEKVPWNELLYWNDGEDVDLSYRLQQQGYVLRFNLNASISTIAWRHGKIPQKYYQYDAQVKTPENQFSIRGGIRTIMYYCMRLPGSKYLLNSMWPIISRSKFYKYILYH